MEHEDFQIPHHWLGGLWKVEKHQYSRRATQGSRHDQQVPLRAGKRHQLPSGPLRRQEPPCSLSWQQADFHSERFPGWQQPHCHHRKHFSIFDQHGRNSLNIGVCQTSKVNQESSYRQWGFQRYNTGAQDWDQATEERPDGARKTFLGADRAEKAMGWSRASLQSLSHQHAAWSRRR